MGLWWVSRVLLRNNEVVGSSYLLEAIGRNISFSKALLWPPRSTKRTTRLAKMGSGQWEKLFMGKIRTR
jgi:hypothetical protein